MNQKISFLLYLDTYESIAHLSDEQCGRLIRALFQYAAAVAVEDTDPAVVAEQMELESDTRMAFFFMAGSIRRDTAAWKQRQQTLSQRAKERKSRMETSKPDDAWKYT